MTENDLIELRNSYDNPEQDTILDTLFKSFLNGDLKVITASKLFVLLLKQKL